MLAFLRSVTEDIEDEDRFVYDELMCEGAVLADFDRRHLLVFGGEDLPREKALQRAYVALLQQAWGGWRVEWAHGGWADIALAAGLEVGPSPPTPPRPLVALKPFEPAQRCWARGANGEYEWVDDPNAWSRPIEPSMLYFNRGGPMTVVTVRDSDGRWRHYQLGHFCEHVFATGLTLMSLLGPIAEASLSPASNCADGGLVIDESNHRIHYWPAGIASSWLADLVERAWTDWDVTRLDEGLPAQMELVGDDPRSVEIPLGVLAEAVVEQLLRDGPGGGGGIAELVEELRQRATEPDAVVSPGSTRLPPGGRPDAAFLVGLLRSLADLR